MVPTWQITVAGKLIWIEQPSYRFCTRTKGKEILSREIWLSLKKLYLPDHIRVTDTFGGIERYAPKSK